MRADLFQLPAIICARALHAGAETADEVSGATFWATISTQRRVTDRYYGDDAEEGDPQNLRVAELCCWRIGDAVDIGTVPRCEVNVGGGAIFGRIINGHMR